MPGFRPWRQRSIGSIRASWEWRGRSRRFRASLQKCSMSGQSGADSRYFAGVPSPDPHACPEQGSGEAMSDAFIYDHVRTPRGRGKADGSLHEVTALNLATQALAAVKERTQLDPTLVDDVVLG